MVRRKEMKKRSLQVVNEHFEFLFNKASAAPGAIQISSQFKITLPDCPDRITSKPF